MQQYTGARAQADVRRYPSEAKEAAFLLGGIGTGNISIGSRGQLRDFELFNQPGKGVNAPFAFFAVWCRQAGSAPVTRVLESKILPPYTNAIGFPTQSFSGLPRLRHASISAKYPFVTVDFEDDKLPAEVALEAFTPFIPLNADDSGIPAAVLRYRVKNPTANDLDVSIAGTLPNMTGYRGVDADKVMDLNQNVSCAHRMHGDVHGLYYTCEDRDQEILRQNNMALLTTGGDVSYKPRWLDKGWVDGIQDFWDDFSTDGRLEVESRVKAPESRYTPTTYQVGSIASSKTLRPGEEAVFEFVISWYFPIRHKDWIVGPVAYTPDWRERTVRNHYATKHASAWDAAAYLLDALPRLEGESRLFTRALYESTLPGYVLEAAASNITVLRSPTCFRIDNGTFLGWEGCLDLNGSCPGSCTHVWNYAQTLAFLFPELERTMRTVELNLETDEDGSMQFRTHRVFGNEKWGFVPAADGQMGSLMRVYREWRLSGDDGFLRSVWDNAKKALDYALTVWDTDGDCVIDGEHHVSYDIEFYGMEPLCNIYLMGALRAMEAMARYLGDEDYAGKCAAAWRAGSAKIDSATFDGEYYYQVLDDVDAHKYQYGKGCLTDHMVGQFLAHVLGLGHLLPEPHVKSSLLSILKYNFVEDFTAFENVQRTYVLNDEKGLVLCRWPKGGKPLLPFGYSDEVWTGTEYAVAVHLIYEGFVEQGLGIVENLRSRHDGYKRNPWNEVECGHHYARSMASWGLITALSGFRFDMVNGNTIGFDPKIHREDFQTFWSTGKAWGLYAQKRCPVTGEVERHIEVLYGEKDISLEENA